MSTRPIRTFSELLPTLNRGRFAEKVNEHLTHALEHLEAMPDEKGGTATLTLTLTVAYQEGRIEVRPAIKSKLPEEKGFAGTPFWSVDGGFSVQHPSQADMFSGPREAPERSRGAGSA